MQDFRRYYKEDVYRDKLIIGVVLSSFDACVQWARLQFEDLFSNSIKQVHPYLFDLS